MQEAIKTGDLVTLKPFAHRRSWEKVGRVQWTRGSYAAVRWVELDRETAEEDLSSLPVTQRSLAELEVFSEEDAVTIRSPRPVPAEPW